MRLQVERPEFINAEYDLRVAGLRHRLPAGDRVQVLHARHPKAQRAVMTS